MLQAEELHRVAHVGSGLQGHDLEHSAHLLAYRIMLLARQPDSGVALTPCEVLRVKPEENTLFEQF